MRRSLVVMLAIPVVLVLACGAGGSRDSGTDGVGPGDAADPGVDGIAGDPGQDEGPGDLLDDGTPGPDAADSEDAVPGDDLPHVDPADVVGPDPTPADWCRRWAEKWCAFQQPCLGGLVPGEGAGACIGRVMRGCWDGRFLAGAVAAGDVAFDGAAGARCLWALMAEDCDAYGQALATSAAGPFPDCDAVVVGTRTDGQACPLGIECAEGSRCVIGAACPGACTAWAKEEGPCDADRPCDPDGAACREGTCVALPGDGEACPEGACARPFACDPQDGRCRTIALRGQPCGPGGGPCMPGLVCLQASRSAAGTCEWPRFNGQSCFEDADCGPYQGKSQACVGGTCGVLPAAGEPCYGFLCGEAWCDTTAVPPTCRALPGTTEACVQGALCAAGLWCDQGTCVAARSDGSPCAWPGQCASARCAAGHCVAIGDPPCTPE